jgi:site-specific DNA-methyltransferase (adenine-specific)
MGRKPISEKTVAENVLEWGTGAINIDGCRVAFQDDNDIKKMERPNCIGKNYGTVKGGETFLSGDIESISNLKAHAQGRFPANIIFDEEAGKILDEQSGISKQSGKLYEGKDSKTSFGQIKSSAVNTNYGDIGGASRFFYCPKTSKSDRSEGNIHPTVKPTDLMAYLIRLVTPKGGIVLDPFMGSGSTGKAAVREGMDFIGIERETEYFEIAKSRIEYEINKPTPKSTKTKKVEVEKKVEEKVNQFFG